jgi:hypothetical protein
MAIPPEKPKMPDAFSARKSPSTSSGLHAPDFLLDPVPVPDVVESNTDTAWGLWEHSLKTSEDPGEDDAQDRDISFEDTVPAGLAELEALKPKR